MSVLGVRVHHRAPAEHGVHGRPPYRHRKLPGARRCCRRWPPGQLRQPQATATRHRRAPQARDGRGGVCADFSRHDAAAEAAPDTPPSSPAAGDGRRVSCDSPRPPPPAIDARLMGLEVSVPPSPATTPRPRPLPTRLPPPLPQEMAAGSAATAPGRHHPLQTRPLLPCRGRWPPARVRRARPPRTLDGSSEASTASTHAGRAEQGGEHGLQSTGGRGLRFRLVSARGDPPQQRKKRAGAVDAVSGMLPSTTAEESRRGTSNFGRRNGRGEQWREKDKLLRAPVEMLLEPHNGHGFLLDEHWRLVATFTAGASEDMVGTYNGLLCFLDAHQGAINVVKPFTGESLALPLPPETERLDEPGAYCFGLDTSSGRYKIFHHGLGWHADDTTEQDMYVYTIGGGESWRSACKSPVRQSPALFADGTFYSYAETAAYRLAHVACFDLATEETTSEHITDFVQADDEHTEFQVMTDSDARVCVGEWGVFFKGEGGCSGGGPRAASGVAAGPATGTSAAGGLPGSRHIRSSGSVGKGQMI
ncbi:hypothetical protein ACQ4PT_037853 [Festuca glaucescens]